MESSKPSSVTTTQIIECLWDLYCENPKRFHIARNGTVYLPKDKGTPRTLQRRHLAGHLAGYYALCLFGQEKASRFLCLDVDHGGWELAQKAISTLKDIGFDRNKIYASTSGNKGYHIEMFFGYTGRDIEPTQKRSSFRLISSESSPFAAWSVVRSIFMYWYGNV